MSYEPPSDEIPSNSEMGCGDEVHCEDQSAMNEAISAFITDSDYPDRKSHNSSVHPIEQRFEQCHIQQCIAVLK